MKIQFPPTRIFLLTALLCLPVLAAAGEPKGNLPARESLRIGRFESPGEYVKDFFVIKNGDTYHLFYNVGTADGKQDWMTAGNEESFGHATSKDLKKWRRHERVIPVQGDDWEGKTVSAPSILRTGKGFSMIYTGFDKQAHGCQRIGLATSPDLFHWTRCEKNPVYVGPAWTDWKPGVWADCRDAHVVEHGGKHYLLTMVRHKDGRGAIAIARSSDLKQWKDLGWAIRVKGSPESPVVFTHAGKFYLIVGADVGACYMSESIESNDWKRVDAFKYPPQGFWSGFEVFRDGARYIAAAFEWKYNGNHIDFWELKFDGDKPYVIYTKADVKRNEKGNQERKNNRRPRGAILWSWLRGHANPRRSVARPFRAAPYFMTLSQGCASLRPGLSWRAAMRLGFHGTPLHDSITIRFSPQAAATASASTTRRSVPAFCPWFRAAASLRK
ncbi:MAG: family 43 glycosylhydrolase [Pirellulales bacterium]|nr:family 43 glycosylhydrolase [Pirellulales bacterium]